MIDDIAIKHGDRNIIEGGDGVVREIITLPGNVNGKDGVYEWIIEQSGEVNHRLFNTRPR